MGFIYFLQNKGCKRIKIGFSIDPPKRLKGLQTGAPYPLKLCGYWEGSRDLEKQLHAALADYNVGGEWFEVKPRYALKKLRELQGKRRLGLEHLPRRNRIMVHRFQRQILYAIGLFVLSLLCTIIDPDINVVGDRYFALSSYVLFAFTVCVNLCGLAIYVITVYKLVKWNREAKQDVNAPIDARQGKGLEVAKNNIFSLKRCLYRVAVGIILVVTTTSAWPTVQEINRLDPSWQHQTVKIYMNVSYFLGIQVLLFHFALLIVWIYRRQQRFY